MPTETTETASSFASASVTRHLLRGVVGFGLIVGSLVLAAAATPLALLLAPLGIVALRGCPTCWAIGLAQSISHGRLERHCEDGSCALVATPATRINLGSTR